MQRTVTVKSSENCLVVSLTGERSYVKILDAESGQLILHSLSSGITEVQHVVKPGRYQVETDGRITKARAMHFEVQDTTG
jgi:hypothetical protein